jgi:hypothetical protein
VVLRRARGLLLRLARHRVAATLVGIFLIVPAAWLEAASPFDAWWIDGLALVLGGTGIALLWTGIAGVRPDWID